MSAEGLPKTNKVYIYKMTTDDGGAPCVYDGVWSLAICKPAIRSTARHGNVILGFAGKDLYENNSLIYVAEVTRHLDGRKYFRDAYSKRPDCIYEWHRGGFERRPDSKFHSAPSNLAHDLGKAPGYKRANVLLSEGTNHFRYFGEKCPVEYKSPYPRLKFLVEGLGQGHRVNFGLELQKELRQFIRRLFQLQFRYREPVVKQSACRDSCSPADEKYAVGEC
jgi:hypothetical protein